MKPLTRNTRSVRRWLDRHGDQTVAELYECLPISEPCIRTALHTLRARRQAKVVGRRRISGRTGMAAEVWSLTEEGRCAR